MERGMREVNPYVLVLVYLLVIIGVVGLVLMLNALLGPRIVPSASKLEPFECGAVPVQQRNVVRLSVRYYPIALFFLLFDLETVLLFICAGSFAHAGITTTGLLTFLFFMAVLTLAFLYLWREGAFEWQ
jgi:NADH-quinone oxidoreductase subunit A